MATQNSKTRRARKPAQAEFTGPVLTVEDGTCGDGCGQTVNKGRSFKQGHDAKLRSILVKALKAGELEVTFVTGGIATTQGIDQVLAEHSWAIPEPKAAKAETEKAA